MKNIPFENVSVYFDIEEQYSFLWKASQTGTEHFNRKTKSCNETILEMGLITLYLI